MAVFLIVFVILVLGEIAAILVVSQNVHRNVIHAAQHLLVSLAVTITDQIARQDASNHVLLSALHVHQAAHQDVNNHVHLSAHQNVLLAALN